MLGTNALRTVAAMLLICPVAAAQADDEQILLFDFSKPDAAKQWQNVNDGVMGGVSDGQVRITNKGIMEFYGTLSLENNGGFASVRSKSKPLGLKEGEVIVARLRGDGREYYLNVTVPTFRIAFSYRASFKTKASDWQEVKTPLTTTVDLDEDYLSTTLLWDVGLLGHGRAVVSLVLQLFDDRLLLTAIDLGPDLDRFLHGLERQELRRAVLWTAKRNDSVSRAMEVHQRHGTVWLGLGNRHRPGHRDDGSNPIG